MQWLGRCGSVARPTGRLRKRRPFLYPERVRNGADRPGLALDRFVAPRLWDTCLPTALVAPRARTRSLGRIVRLGGSKPEADTADRFVAGLLLSAPFRTRSGYSADQ